MESSDLVLLMERQLPDAILEVVRLAGRLAAEGGREAYLVGGVVRDLMLGRPGTDVDVVVEGDAIELAHRLVAQQGTLVAVHPRFGTAKLRLGEQSLDLITARRETYPRPGALPQVAPGSIQDDLKRRDFSINAMAIHVSPSRFGTLLDPHQGRRDLQLCLVRVLPGDSFKEDATRMLRALRYEARLGFRLESETEGLMRRDAGMLDTISGDRLRHELMLILGEDCPEAVLRRAEEMRLLQRLHLSLKGDGELARVFPGVRRLDLSPSARAAVYLALLVYSFKEGEGEELVARLRFSAAIAGLLRDTVRLGPVLPKLDGPELSHSSIYHLLEGHNPQAVLAASLVAATPLVSARLRLYLEKLRLVRPALNGDDLKRLGVPPGPALGEILARLRDARLEGLVKNETQEEVLVRLWMESRGFPLQTSDE